MNQRANRTWSDHKPTSLITTPARSQDVSVDQTGDAILELLERAANAAKKDFDRAAAMSHELSLQLRAAEDRSEQLQIKVKQLEDDARKAEDWLSQIYQEIQGRFFGKKELGHRQP